MDTRTPPARYLGETEVALAAAAVADGRDPGLQNCHAEGVAKVFAAAMRIRVRRAWKAADLAMMMREAAREPTPAEEEDEEEEPVHRPRRYGSRRVPRPDAIVRELLTSPEAMVLLNLLAGLVAIGTRIPSWNVPGDLGEGGSFLNRPSIQARYLRNYIRQKVKGDPILRGGVRVGYAGPPATYPAPKAAFLPSALRAWANSLTPQEAAGWDDLAELEAALDEIHEAGAEVQAAYGTAFNRIGWPIAAVDHGLPLGLPLEPPRSIPEAEPGSPAPAPPSGPRMSRKRVEDGG